MKIVYLSFILLSFLNETEGGKLMEKLFQCRAKKKESMSKRSAVAEVGHHVPFDEETRMRETVAKAEANMNRHYFQGDMMLTHTQQKVMNNALLLANKRTDLENRAMIKDIARLWPNGQVFYTFNAGVDEEGKAVANAAMKHWTERTCVKFTERKNENDYVEFEFGDGCASRVGRLGGRQEILIGSKEAKCKVGNLIHELGHTLGFFHEHSRPDRDNFVHIAWDLVRPGFEINFKKLPADWIDSRDVAYDYGSIMHYPRTIFGKSPWDETVVTTDANAQVGQRIALSGPDILQAKKLYSCGGLSEKTTSKKSKN